MTTNKQIKVNTVKLIYQRTQRLNNTYESKIYQFNSIQILLANHVKRANISLAIHILFKLLQSYIMNTKLYNKYMQQEISINSFNDKFYFFIYALMSTFLKVSAKILKY